MNKAFLVVFLFVGLAALCWASTDCPPNVCSTTKCPSYITEDYCHMRKMFYVPHGWPCGCCPRCRIRY
ncbi:unnamed protein product [Nezara viridula]|uniref:Neuropeptide n=1 Tax=Nezara viridula TaxID=85310 RepID=A0A9P0EES3_NEZVI|nr:unnamed protein product [Nezara viridula]